VLFISPLRLSTIPARVLGEKHPHVAASRNNLAELLETQGKYDDAKAILAEVLKIRCQKLGSTHSDRVVTECWIAMCMELTGDIAGARTTMQRVVPLMEQLLML
jgi:ATP/maltotriose-dependent transcriptional regulator MalT